MVAAVKKNVVYEAVVTQNTGYNTGLQHSYIGLTSQTFKERYSKHQSSLRNQSKDSATTLSEHVHKLNRDNVEYAIDWKIIDRAKSYNGRTCDLCLTEKTRII